MTIRVEFSQYLYFVPFKRWFALWIIKGKKVEGLEEGTEDMEWELLFFDIIREGNVLTNMQ